MKPVSKELGRLRDRLEKVLSLHGLDLKQLNKVLDAAKAARPDVDLSNEQSRQLTLGQLRGDRKKFVVEAMSVMSDFERLWAKEYEEASARTAGAARARAPAEKH